MKHELVRGVRGVDSRSDGVRRHGLSTSPTARAASLVVSFSRALDLGVQGKWEPRRRPLEPRPQHLLPSTLISAAED